MKIINVIVEKSDDGHYSAYSDDVDGLFGAGDTVDEAQRSIYEGIEVMRGFDKPPAILKEQLQIEWTYDVQSYLRYWKNYLTFNGMERVTGIDAKQLQHYSTGHKVPRKPNKEKIVEGFNSFAKKLESHKLMLP